MMKSILLKLDDKLFEETEALVKVEQTSRLSYIKQAIAHYNKWQMNKALEEQISREVELLKKHDPDAQLKHEFESASLEDLQKLLGDY